jgi:hypothetical protein
MDDVEFGVFEVENEYVYVIGDVCAPTTLPVEYLIPMKNVFVPDPALKLTFTLPLLPGLTVAPVTLLQFAS